MNIFRRNYRPCAKRLLKLQSVFATILALCLYTLCSHYLLRPQLLCVQEQTSSCALLSTDLCDPIRVSIRESIEQAKDSVVLIIYSLSDKKIISALQAAADRGVTVSVIYDSSESPDLNFHLGKKIKSFPRHNKGLMHHKFLAIDHHIVWLGSANFTTNSFLQQGNIVIGVNSPAMARHIESLGESFVHSSKFTDPPLHLSLPEQKLTLFIHPAQGGQSLKALTERIDRASKRVFVAMFTFTHPELTAALLRAKKRGVDVRVVLDQDSARATSRKSYLQCKRDGIITGTRTKSGLLHYKTAVIDTCLVTGSANWTQAGFSLNNDSLLLIEPLTQLQEKWIERWWQTVERQSTISTQYSR